MDTKTMVNGRVERELRVKRQTPPWLTQSHKDEMDSLRLEAKRKTAETGVFHHVDHLYPIAGELVSGLNVPWNMWVIPQAHNDSKGNRMPYDAEIVEFDKVISARRNGHSQTYSYEAVVATEIQTEAKARRYGMSVKRYRTVKARADMYGMSILEYSEMESSLASTNMSVTEYLARRKLLQQAQLARQEAERIKQKAAAIAKEKQDASAKRYAVIIFFILCLMALTPEVGLVAALILCGAILLTITATWATIKSLADAHPTN